MPRSSSSIAMADRPLADSPADDDTGGRLTRVVPIAIDLFTQRGYDNVTMDEIGVAAGISRRSLFRHFRQKDELIVRWMGRFNDQLCASIVRQPGDLTMIQAFRRALDDVDDLSSSGLGRLLMFSGLAANSAAVAAAMSRAERGWEDAATEALRRRDGDSAQDDDMAYRAAAGVGLLALRLATDAWRNLPGESADREALFEQLDTAFAACHHASNISGGRE